MNSVDSFRNSNVGKSTPDGFLISRSLAWLSVGLGAVGLLAPRVVTKLVGVAPTPRATATVRTIGLRELVVGLGIMMRPRRPLPMWSRAAGDMADLALLAWMLTGKRTDKQRAIAALIAIGGMTAFDIYASRRVMHAQEMSAEPVVFSVTINKSPDEVYRFFRKLENLPLFMNYLESVKETSEMESHWVAKLPLGATAEWNAELTADRPGELIAWHTVDAKHFAHRGKVMFAKTPGGNGTEVRVELELALPGMQPSAMLAKLLTKPQIKGDLLRLKQVMETGEVLFSDASAHRGKYPAQPSESGARYARAHAESSHDAADRGGLT